MTAVAVVVCALCWYFRSVLIYIILAAVIALVSRPMMSAMKRIKITGKQIPEWILAIISIVIIFGIIIGVVTQIIPIIYNIVQSVSANLQSSSMSTEALRNFFTNANYTIHEWFPNLEEDVTIQSLTVNFIKDTHDLSSVT